MDLDRRTRPTFTERIQFALQTLCDLGDGPFAGDSGKIKQARFLPAA